MPESGRQEPPAFEGWPDFFVRQHSGALLRLLRLLEDEETGFQCIIIEYSDSAYQEKIIHYLSSRFPGQAVLDAAATDTFSVLETKLEKLAQENNPIHIVGTGNWFASGQESFRFAHGFNYHREKLTRTVSCSILLWLHRDQVTLFAREAPDMWAWRTMLIDFSSPADAVLSDVHTQTIKPWAAPEGRKQERVQEIDNYLKGKHFKAADSRLLREKAEILYSHGKWKQALKTVKKALEVAKNHDDKRSEAFAHSIRADILQARGELDGALHILQEELLPVFERLGDVRSRAVTMGKIADILQARGELDEALRIRQEEELPVYERLGDVRERAVTMGKIADILQDRGELDEALRIRQEEQLPVYERLGDVRERTVTMGQIADILQSRGELDEALRIRQEEQLPVYERLGDVRSRAVTMGKVADILQSRGELDEALRIRQEEQLPVFERLGDVRSRAVTMGKIADILQSRGELDEALRINQEELLSVYEQLGDVRELLVARTKLALLLLQKENKKDRIKIQQLLCLALEDARRLNIPEQNIIADIMKRENIRCP